MHKYKVRILPERDGFGSHVHEVVEADEWKVGVAGELLFFKGRATTPSVKIAATFVKVFSPSGWLSMEKID